MQHNDIYKFLDSLTESKKAELFTDAVIEIFTKADIAAQESEATRNNPEDSNHTAGFNSGKLFAYSDTLTILMGEDGECKNKSTPLSEADIKAGDACTGRFIPPLHKVLPMRQINEL